MANQILCLDVPWMVAIVELTSKQVDSTSSIGNFRRRASCG